MNPDEVSKAFVEHYYSTFDLNRAALANLYQEGSMLTFEGQKIQGSQNIVAKLTTLPFQQCKHNITTVDCQPSRDLLDVLDRLLHISLLGFFFWVAFLWVGFDFGLFIEVWLCGRGGF